MRHLTIKKIRKFLKVYFWVLLPLIVLAYIVEGAKGQLSTAINYVDIIISLPGLLALFLYVYKKKLFAPLFWRIYFFVIIFWDIWYNIWWFKLDSDNTYSFAANIVGLILAFIFLLPLYGSIYLYGFMFLNGKEEEIVETDEVKQVFQKTNPAALPYAINRAKTMEYSNQQVNNYTGTTKSHLSLFKVISIIIIALTIAMLWVEWIAKLEDTEEFGFDEESKQCNVAFIPLHGYLTTYQSIVYDADGRELTSTSSDVVVDNTNDAVEDEDIKAIFLEVDSPGGFSVGAEEIATALKKVEKPTAALIREMGTSGAYWAATGADVIYAFKNSTIGGIGASMSYLEKVEHNIKDGFMYQEISSGKFKDAGDPSRPLTDEEKNLFLRDVKIVHENFIQAIALNRAIEIEKVRSIADGSTLLGESALANKLIDAIGDMSDVKTYLQKRIGEEVVLCERDFGIF